ncbi:hypothetical protein E8E14_001690 [Neopestalotiopsis sp. 37M]|nr:hypothetical protein E8E14_001690 [Neopestalotiopsis sp. 37M]
MMEPTHSLRPAVWNAAEEKDLTAWNKHRDTLQYLYVDEGCSLKAIKQKMETEHGFPSFRLKDYETVFRDHFHFRKNLEQKDWESIAYQIEERKRKGKASVVYMGNRLLTTKRVQRGTRKYSLNPNNKFKTNRSHLLNSRIRIKTPPPKSLEVDHGSTELYNTDVVSIDIKSSTPFLEPYPVNPANYHGSADEGRQSAPLISAPSIAYPEVIPEPTAQSQNQIGYDAGQEHGLQSDPRVILPGIGTMLARPIVNGRSSSTSGHADNATENNEEHVAEDTALVTTGSTAVQALPSNTADTNWQTSSAVVRTRQGNGFDHVPRDRSSTSVGYLGSMSPTQPLEKLLITSRSFLACKFETGTLIAKHNRNPALLQKQFCRIEKWYNDFNPGFDLLVNEKVPAAFRIFQKCFEATHKVIRPEYPFMMVYVGHQAIRCAFYDKLGRTMTKFLLRHVAELCGVFLGEQHPLSIITDGLARMDIFEFALCIGPFMEFYCDALESYLGKSDVGLGELSGARGLTISLMEGTGMLGLYEAKPRLEKVTRRARERGLCTLHLEIEMAAMLVRNKFLDESLALILQVRQSKECQANRYEYLYSDIILMHVLRALKDHDRHIQHLYDMAASLIIVPVDDDSVEVVHSSRVYEEIRHSTLLLVYGWLEKALRKLGREEEADGIQARCEMTVDDPMYAVSTSKL